MKDYPKMPGPEGIPFGQKAVVFEKMDGSNLRFEWSKNQGWYKFGTRTRLFDHTDPDFGTAIDIFLSRYGDKLDKIVCDAYKQFKVTAIIAYAEFFGPHSFCGQHSIEWLNEHISPPIEHNDPKNVILFDVNVHKKGFIDPERFIDLFGHLGIPPVLYKGILTEDFVEEVRNGRFPVMEGVVCKGGEGHKLWMAKIKTLNYLGRLKQVFQQNYGSYWE